jgi:RNA polymerase sigma factor (sigma-70 family)
MTTESSGWLDELYRANYLPVARLCGKILRNPDDAADAAQEVFLVAMDSLRPDAKPAQARSWLLTVARNHCLDLLRRRKRMGQALVTLNAESTDVDFESAVANRDFVDIVFSKLTARERRALWESAVEHRPLADIASRLQLSYMAAAQVVHRARRHAFEMAARVAVVLGGFQIGRLLKRLAQAPDRLVAMAAVPMILIASQTSSSPAVPRQTPTVSVAQPQQAQPRGPSASNAGSTQGTASRSTRSGPSIVDSATGPVSGAVQQLTGALPGVTKPSLPAVPQPSLPPLPVPSISPGLP